MPSLTPRIDDVELNISKVGDVVSAILTEGQFQSQRNATWVLMDGRDVTGSDYHTLTASANIPDARGRALRGKDEGAGVNPDGEIALGDNQEDEFENHTHTTDAGTVSFVLQVGGSGIKNNPSNTGSAGGNETRMKNTTVNYFIKINE